MVTEAVVRYGKWDKVIGLCNVPVMAMMTEPVMISEKKEELIYRICWAEPFPLAQSSGSKGNDRTEDLIEQLYAEDNGLPKTYSMCHSLENNSIR